MLWLSRSTISPKLKVLWGVKKGPNPRLAHVLNQRATAAELTEKVNAGNLLKKVKADQICILLCILIPVYHNLH